MIFWTKAFHNFGKPCNGGKLTSLINFRRIVPSADIVVVLAKIGEAPLGELLSIVNLERSH